MSAKTTTQTWGVVVLAICAMALALSFAVAANRVSGIVYVTNAPTHGMTFVVNGDTRTWKTNGAVLLGSDIAISNLNSQNATNLHTAVAASPFAGPVTITWSSTNAVKFTAMPGNALAVTVSNSWGYVTIATNQTSTGIVTRLPIEQLFTNTMKTNVATEIVKGINSFSTQRFTLAVLPVGSTTNITTTVPWLTISTGAAPVLSTNTTRIAADNLPLTASTNSTSAVPWLTFTVSGNTHTLSTNTARIAINVNTDNNAAGLTNFPSGLTNGYLRVADLTAATNALPFVDLASAQTVTGAKSFSATTTLISLGVFSNVINQVGVAGISNNFAAITLFNSNVWVKGMLASTNAPILATGAAITPGTVAVFTSGTLGAAQPNTANLELIRLVRQGSVSHIFKTGTGSAADLVYSNDNSGRFWSDMNISVRAGVTYQYAGVAGWTGVVTNQGVGTSTNYIAYAGGVVTNVVRDGP